MMKNFKDMTGKKINRLTCKSIHSSTPRGVYWLCECECGKEVVVRGQAVRSGDTKSCGCLTIDVIKSQIGEKHPNFIHGMTHTNIYKRWKSINERCYKKRCKAYKNYGGRGIKCEWISFEEFYKDMGNPPGDLTLDRIDNDGNYSKENCKWSSKSEQANNRRTAHMLTYHGETKNMKSWAKQFGMDNRKLWWRIKQGWSIKDALETKIRTYRVQKSTLIN